jgi:hypothetical protein
MINKPTTSDLLELILTRPLFTQKDLARRYAVTIRTIRRWTASGYLPAPDPISGPRWRPATIDRWERRRSGGAPAAQS